MKRSKFSLSFHKLFSCDMGELVPCGLVEVLPGDTVQQATSALIRCSPLLAPVMHPVDARIHHFFVPHRLVWNDWENFITGGPDGLNASVFPTISFPNGGPEVGTLADYLGVPTDIVNAGGTSVSALPFRGYSLIWNEFYRDQDLETALTIDLTDGADTTTNVALKNCAWEKDYFTSARPWEQKGPSVTVPLGTTAPVKGIGFVGTLGGTIATSASARETTPLTSPRNYAFAASTANSGINIEADSDVEGSAKPLVYADLSQASAVTVNLLREALALQRFEEARARYGSRYVEYLRYLGVQSSDARLQRPEYLGGGTQRIQFSEVLATAETGATVDVGDMKGHGIGAMRSNRYRRYFEEHGYVFSLMSVRPKTIYADGLFRTWNRRSKEDFWQKELQHIGQQQVLRKEVYASASSPDAVFGYQDMYDDYRRMESSVSGEFRSTVLNFWHQARIFAAEPSLNATFVSCVPTERIFAVPANDVIYVMAKHSIQARRLVAASGHSFIF